MNWFKKSKLQTTPLHPKDLILNEETFYQKFIHDLSQAREEVIIESPFITRRRFDYLKPTLMKLIKNGIKIYIVTRDPSIHEEPMSMQAENAVCFCEQVGIQVLIPKTKIHRKIAIIDRRIVYSGSLNILSFAQGWEFMERKVDTSRAEELFKNFSYFQYGVFSKKLNLV